MSSWETFMANAYPFMHGMKTKTTVEDKHKKLLNEIYTVFQKANIKLLQALYQQLAVMNSWELIKANAYPIIPIMDYDGYGYPLNTPLNIPYDSPNNFPALMGHPPVKTTPRHPENPVTDARNPLYPWIPASPGGSYKYHMPGFPLAPELTLPVSLPPFPEASPLDSHSSIPTAPAAPHIAAGPASNAPAAPEPIVPVVPAAASPVAASPAALKSEAVIPYPAEFTPTELAAAELAAVQPPAYKVVGAKPVAAEPFLAEPVPVKPYPAELAVAELAAAEFVAAKPAAAEPFLIPQRLLSASNSNELLLNLNNAQLLPLQLQGPFNSLIPPFSGIVQQQQQAQLPRLSQFSLSTLDQFARLLPNRIPFQGQVTFAQGTHTGQLDPLQSQTPLQTQQGSNHMLQSYYPIYMFLPWESQQTVTQSPAQTGQQQFEEQAILGGQQHLAFDPFLSIAPETAVMCPENDARLFDQKTMPYTLLPLVLNSYPAFKPSYYPYYPVMSMNNPYMSHKVYKNPVVFRSLAHIPHWTQMPYIYLPPMVHYPTSHPQLKGMSLKKIPTKTNTPTINTIASVEPTPIPNIEPMVNTPVVTPETSSEFIIKNTPETTTVPVSSPTA
ncbi:Odontogenic ameloblast-associated protein [Tupaia chinensis]|uniref:Odontogenic ameloblast-associated protein n=1 Tax=Tupaia chinensis TaxID=246437 RepID=L9L9P8_TUPCH|nr:Odontogenic ameloblast-associated protein [Tupaia chinensis]